MKVVAGVPLQIRDAPGQPLGAGDGKQRATGQRGAQHIMLVRGPHRSTASYQMAGRRLTSKCGSVASRAPPAGAAPRAHGPGVAAGQPRQIGDQLQGLVRQLAADLQLAQQIEIGVVQQRLEQLAHFVVGDAGLDQLQQDPFVLLLADGQSAVVQQVADQQHRLLVPRLGMKPVAHIGSERPDSFMPSLTPSQ